MQYVLLVDNAALHLTIATLLNAGDHIISSNRIYGGSRNLLGLTLKRFRISTTFVDPNNLNEIKKNIKKNTKLFFAETLGNPKLEVLDIEKVSKIVSKEKIPFLVDNTIPTPYLCNPFDYGANLIMHSTTKFIGGHIAVGGVVIDSGSFDWSKTKKFSNLTKPYEGYHNLNFL